MNKLRAPYFLVFVLSFSHCTEDKPLTNEIEVEINTDNQYFVNGKQVAGEELKKVLSGEKGKLAASHFKEDEITIILRVDPAAKRWALADLEVILRQLNMRKIKYMKEALRYSSDPAHSS
jgi:biopolymer transport protein ExbD